MAYDECVGESAALGAKQTATWVGPGAWWPAKWGTGDSATCHGATERLITDPTWQTVESNLLRGRLTRTELQGPLLFT